MAIKVNNTTVINDSRAILNSTGIEVSGIVTASPGAAITYYGDGSNLTGVNVGTEFDNITSGIITASAYDGFVVADTQTISDNFEFNNNKPNLTFAQDLVISPGVAFTVSAGTTVTVNPFRDIEPGTFEIPSGTTEERQGTPSTGALRYNTDLNEIEVYIGSEWRQVELEPTRRGKAITAVTPIAGEHQIESFNINTGGQCFYFGNLSVSRYHHTTCANSNRGLFAGGATSSPTTSDVIDYITIASEGNALDFGDLVSARSEMAALSNSVRGVFIAGFFSPTPSTSVSPDKDLVIIASQGNATDFGNMHSSSTARLAGCASPTRGIYGGGYDTPSPKSAIGYFDIASDGEAYDFGTLSGRQYLGSCSSTTRGLFAGGLLSNTPTSHTDFIEYITIASRSNAISFGSLYVPKRSTGTTSNSIRGIFIGGVGNSPADLRSEIEFVNISSLGNTTLYGSVERDRANSRERVSTSDSHGGLG